VVSDEKDILRQLSPHSAKSEGIALRNIMKMLLALLLDIFECFVEGNVLYLAA